ncbi:hypothetical protein EDD16DRAFT_1903703 [Pisolithus croceorrhizus]|nr:hypothetical protein EDD16DRAFT_1903703 [Pisolithus croceorrhizus]
MFDMPGRIPCCTTDSSSSIESSSSSLHTTRGLEDIQTIPESTLFDDDGSQNGCGDVRHPSFQEQQRILQQQYEDLHRTALNGVVKDFQAQKDALGEMETVLQKRETELTSLRAELETHAKERAAHQEQLYNEQLTGYCNGTIHNLKSFKGDSRYLELQSQMEKMSTSRAANLEAHVQEEVTRLRESLQAGEGEGNGETRSKRSRRLRESLQAEKEREMANFEQQHHSHEKSSASYIAFLTTLPVLLLILLGPLDRLNFHKPVPLLSMLLKGLGEPGASQHELVSLELPVDIQEDVGNEGNGGSPGERQTSPVEGGEPSGGSSNTVPISAMVEAVTRGVEAVLHNVLADGKMIPSRSGRRSRRRRVCEDEEVKLEKESEPVVHRDFILAEVRRLFKEKLGITQDLDFITHLPSRSRRRPCLRNYSSPWNTYILKAALSRAPSMLQGRELANQKRRQLYYGDTSGTLQATADGVLETPTETEVRLVEGRIQMGKDSRQANRSPELVMVLDEMVKSKSEAQDDDLQSWKWLRSLIKMLGEHGMSSEESSVENGVENVLRVKNMPWRRNIDLGTGNSSKPLTHKRSPDNPSTTRDAVKALPLALYDGAWFAQLTERQIEALNVPQQTFSWMKVVVA